MTAYNSKWKYLKVAVVVCVPQTALNLVTLQRTIMKYTKIYHAGAQLWVCSLRLLLGDILVAVGVMVWLSSLLFGAYGINTGLTHLIVQYV